MPVTDETPTAPRGFREWQYALFRHAPKQLGKVIIASKQIRAATSPRRGRG
jgi:hypothetical protein